MADELFNIVFNGKTISGVTPDRAKYNLQRVMEIDPQILDRLFAGKPVVLKRNVNHSESIKYLQALTAAGLITRIAPISIQIPEGKPAGHKTQLEQNTSTAPENPMLMPCPGCGKEVSRAAASCPSCGHPITLPNIQHQPSSSTVAPEDNSNISPVSSAPTQPSVNHRRSAARKPKHEYSSTNMTLGLFGAGLLLFGAFLPMVTLPIVGSISYFANGQGDGVFVVIIAFITLLICLRKKFSYLAICAVVVLIMMAYTYTNLTSVIETYQKQMENNVFGKVLSHAFQLGWAWAVLVAGVICLFAAAVTKTRVK